MRFFISISTPFPSGKYSRYDQTISGNFSVDEEDTTATPTLPDPTSKTTPKETSGFFPLPDSNNIYVL